MHRKVKIRVIEVESPSDPKTGYLSNASRYSFELEGKKWPTVEHYLLAKRFAGTEYEEKIRLSPTLIKAQNLVRGRYQILDEDGRTVRRKVYGRGSVASVPKEWKQQEPQYLEAALKAKFYQNERLAKRLVDTAPDEIVDPHNPYTGGFLMKLRDEMMTPTLPLRRGPTSDDARDVKVAKLTSSEKEVVNGLITMTEMIRDMEGQTSIYSEMVEDVIYNLMPKEKEGGTLTRDIASFVDRTSWQTIAREMPNFEKMIEEVNRIFSETDETQKHQVRGSVLIAGVIRWIRLDASAEEKKTVTERALNPGKITLRLMKEKRWYRRGIPPVLGEQLVEGRQRKAKKTRAPKVTPPKPKKPKPVSDVVEIAKPKKKTPSPKLKTKVPATKLKTKVPVPKPKTKVPKTKVPSPKKTPKKSPKKASPKKKKTPETLTIYVQSNGNFRVEGQNRPKYAAKLLGLGGKYPRKKSKETGKFESSYESINFTPATDKAAVEAIVFEDLPDETKYNVVYQSWLKGKFELFLDTASQVAKVKGDDKITRDTIKLVVEKIYGCRGVPDKESEETDFEIDSSLTSVPLEKSAEQYIRRWVGHLGKLLTDPVNDYTEYVQRLDSVNQWLIKAEMCSSSHGLSADQMCALMAMVHLLESTDQEIEPGTAEWSFLTLATPKFREGAEQYLTAVFAGYREGEKLAPQYLSSIGITLKIDELKKAIEEVSEWDTSGDQATVLIFAAAVTYFQNLIKKGGATAEKLRLRLKVLSNASPKKVPKITAPKKTVPKKPTTKEVIEVAEGLTSAESPYDVVAVLVNSSGKHLPSDPTESERVTDAVFETYPWGNIYEGGESRGLGSVVVRSSNGRPSKVASLIAAVDEGDPRATVDTVDNRKRWFTEAVRKLLSAKGVKSVAFSAQQLEPDGYLSIVKAAAEGSPIQVYIMTGETETLRPQETGKVQLPSAVAMYTAKDVDDDMSRAVIYINLLKPHNLSPTEFSQATETLDGMKKADKLKWLNNFSSLRLPQQKAALRTLLKAS